MEASAIPAASGLARTRVSVGAPLLRLRSDEQLVALFREGNDEAFRAIHDRYSQRLFAYARQMLPGSRQDAEDALQDVFVRAYAALRSDRRTLSLRPWLYRVAHNRCVDQLRRAPLAGAELRELARTSGPDPAAQAEQRDVLRRLVSDLRRLPEQQRSALLMRELAGLTYVELSAALGVSVPAVKSLLVRARVGLAKAAEARDASCTLIRNELILAHDRGVRPGGMARRHLRECSACADFRHDMRCTSRQLAALAPALGPLGIIAKLLGFGGGSGAAASSGAVASGGAATGGAAAASGGAVASVGIVGGAGHVATLLAAVVTAGGAVAVQHTLASAQHHRALPTRQAAVSAPAPSQASGPGAQSEAPAATVSQTAATSAAASRMTRGKAGQSGPTLFAVRSTTAPTGPPASNGATPAQPPVSTAPGSTVVTPPVSAPAPIDPSSPTGTSSGGGSSPAGSGDSAGAGSSSGTGGAPSSSTSTTSTVPTVTGASSQSSAQSVTDGPASLS